MKNLLLLLTALLTLILSYNFGLWIHAHTSAYTAVNLGENIVFENSNHRLKKRLAPLLGPVAFDLAYSPDRYYNYSHAHGFGMAIVFLIVFPFGAFYARYFRSNLYWIKTHAAIQSFGVLLVYCLLIVIV